MRSSSSSLNSSNARSAYMAAGGRDPSVAASSRTPSRPASQPASLPSSGLPLQGMRQSHGSRDGYSASQGGQSQSPSNPAMPRGARPSAQSGSAGRWRASQGSGGGGLAGAAGSAPAPSLPGASPAGPSQANSGSWRRSLGGGAAQPSTSNEPEAGRRSQASIRGGGSGASASKPETRSRDNLAEGAQRREGDSDMLPGGKSSAFNPPEDEKVKRSGSDIESLDYNHSQDSDYYYWDGGRVGSPAFVIL
jgi:hypothetical protein